jgi:hypothetical protein
LARALLQIGITTTHQTVAQHCDEAVRVGLGLIERVNEYGDVTAALELMINHCDVFDGDANPFLARRESCEALLKKLRAASLVVTARSTTDHRPRRGQRKADDPDRRQ